jgi:Flp pilus assembly protein TadD
MKRFLAAVLMIAVARFVEVRAETESIDLKALAKKARPAVLLLVVSDANGKEIATGTGFLVSSDGKLITNHHVIEKAANAIAKAENDGLFPVEGVLVDDPKNDLVLLKVKGKDLPFLTLGKSENIEVGTRIAVIGSPLGLEGTLSEGIISAVRELMGNIRKLQITAAISPGSSGSPVMNAKGDVVGIAAALLREGQSLNLAVPVECANRLMAKNTATAKPQPLGNSAVDGNDEDAIYSDPDWRASCAAEANGDSIEGLKRSKVLVKRYPNNATAWFGLGSAFDILDFTEDAIAAYRHAIKIKPDDSDSWYNLGNAYRKSGRTSDAIAAYRQSIKLKPNFAKAWCNLGACYDDSGRIEDAILAFRQTIKIEQGEAVAWYGLGVDYRKSGQTEDAIRAYQQAIKLKPDFAEAWYALGLCYRHSGNVETAEEALGKARILKPELFKQKRN